MYRICALILSLFVLSGCGLFNGTSPAITPGTGKGTAYPCGYTGVVCNDQASMLTPDVAACCWQNSVCKIDDDGPYCEGIAHDPSDPATMGAKRSVRIKRFGTSRF